MCRSDGIFLTYKTISGIAHLTLNPNLFSCWNNHEMRLCENGSILPANRPTGAVPPSKLTEPAGHKEGEHLQDARMPRGQPCQGSTADEKQPEGRRPTDHYCDNKLHILKALHQRTTQSMTAAKGRENVCIHDICDNDDADNTLRESSPAVEITDWVDELRNNGILWGYLEERNDNDERNNEATLSATKIGRHHPSMQHHHTAQHHHLLANLS
jgi:hypothetical protein